MSVWVFPKEISIWIRLSKRIVFHQLWQPSSNPSRAWTEQKRWRKDKFSLSSWAGTLELLGLGPSDQHQQLPSSWAFGLQWFMWLSGLWTWTEFYTSSFPVPIAWGGKTVGFVSLYNMWANSYNKSPLTCISIFPIGSFSLENPNTVSLLLPGLYCVMLKYNL